jgi:hypothetical protein
MKEYYRLGMLLFSHDNHEYKHKFRYFPLNKPKMILGTLSISYKNLNKRNEELHNLSTLSSVNACSHSVQNISSSFVLYKNVNFPL